MREYILPISDFQIANVENVVKLMNECVELIFSPRSHTRYTLQNYSLTQQTYLFIWERIWILEWTRTILHWIILEREINIECVCLRIVNEMCFSFRFLCG